MSFCRSCCGQIAILLLAVAAVASAAIVASSAANGGSEPVARQARVYNADKLGSTPSSFVNDLKHVYKIYEECNAKQLAPCLKLKFLTALERVSRKSELPIMDGVVLVKDTADDASDDRPKDDSENSLPRSLDEKDDGKLDGLIMDRVLNFFSARSIQFKLTGLKEMQRSLQENAADARGKKGKMGGLMMIPLMMAGSMIPLALGTLALLAGKALIIAKLALTLSLIIGLKKLLSQDDHHGSGYQVVHSGGHYRRSIQAEPVVNAAAQSLAYRSYIPLNQDSSTGVYMPAQ